MKVKESDISFIDAISNGLGAIIIITLLVLFFSKYAQQDQLDDEEQTPQGLTVKTCRDLIRPWSKEYLVLNNRLVLLDKAALGKAILDSPEDGTGLIQGNIEEGSFIFDTYRDNSRDINLFDLKFSPDLPAIEKKYPSLPKSDLEKTARELLTVAKSTHSLLFFAVYPSGMDIFASLYPQLLKNRVPFQAIYLTIEQNFIDLQRDPSQFQKFEIEYYC